ncbi:MAG: serine/threonine protein kinase [Verrucomicrobiaceae bacterium]|nr:serine/threonine protein kinase [Verrucomicrobiaceae bacterium]
MNSTNPSSGADDATRVVPPTPAQLRASSDAGQPRPTGPRGDWHPPSPWDLAKLLPQYQIDSMIGRGGMGAVYRGKQTSLDRAVAIKLLPSEMAADEEFVGRFQREARTLAKLQHPGIVAVYDFGQTSEGHLYFVMEYVDGVDLACVIHGDGLNPLQSLDLCSQICGALQYAHEMGVMHRDIKPANVLLTKTGKAKLADFGLARPMVEDHSTAFTRTNTVMGTPDYMAPEQLLGLADHRADLYAVGVMLYEMLTKQKPRGAWEPPSRKVPVDVQLDQVVIKALQYEREKRYQNATEMKTAVDTVRARTESGKPQFHKPDQNSTANSGDKPKHSWTPLVAAVILLLGGGGGFVAWQKMQPPPVQPPPPEPPKPEGVPASMARNFVTKKGGIIMVFNTETQTWSSDPKAFDTARDGQPDEWAGQITAAEQANGSIPKHYRFEVADDGAVKVVPGAPKFLVAFPASAAAPAEGKPGSIASPINGKPVPVEAKDWHPNAKVMCPTSQQFFLLPEDLPKLAASATGAKAPTTSQPGSVLSPFTNKPLSVNLKEWVGGTVVKCPDSGFEFLLPSDLPMPVASLENAVLPTVKQPGSVMSPFANSPVSVTAAEWRPKAKLKCPASDRAFVLPDELPPLTADLEGAVAPKAGAAGTVLSPYSQKAVTVEAKAWQAKTKLKCPETSLEFLLPEGLPLAVAVIDGAVAPKGGQPGSIKSPFTGNPVPVAITDWRSGAELKCPETSLPFLAPAEPLPKPVASIENAVKPKGSKAGSVVGPFSGNPVAVERKDWHPGSTLSDGDQKEFVLPGDLPMLVASTSGAKAPIGTKSGTIESPYSGDEVTVSRSKWKADAVIHCPKADFDFLLPDDLPEPKEEAPAMTVAKPETPTAKPETRTPTAAAGNIPPSMQRSFVTPRNSIFMKFNPATGTWASNPGVYLSGSGNPKQFARDMTVSSRGKIPSNYHFEVTADGGLVIVPD